MSRLLILLILLILLLLPLQIARAEVRLEGDAIQGGLLFGLADENERVFLGERELPKNDQGRFLIGFGRDAAETAELRILDREGKKTRRIVKIARRDYRIQRIDGIEKKFMELDEATLKRVRKEQSLARKARATPDIAEGAFEAFIWPVRGPITGVYGSQRIFNGEPRRPHFGIDIAAPNGTPVEAPASGRVVLAHPDMFFSGGTLILDHGMGLFSSFLHLSRLKVAEGDEVTQGEIIAEVGATGRVTGAHLDWRMNWFEERIDPAQLVPAMELR